MRNKNKSSNSAPKCVFCGKSHGVQFNIFTPRFKPFGTACVECEKTLPEGTQVPAINIAHEAKIFTDLPLNMMKNRI